MLCILVILSAVASLAGVLLLGLPGRLGRPSLPGTRARRNVPGHQTGCGLAECVVSIHSWSAGPALGLFRGSAILISEQKRVHLNSS